MTLSASCIVADPPQYTDPVKTRPELSAYGATPPVYQVRVIDTPSPSTPFFKVPVRSEDAGEELSANVWLDYGTPNVTFVSNQKIPASTYNDTSDRAINFSWTTISTVKNGCHTLTIVVAHSSSYPKSTLVLDTILAAKDAAIITWWVNVNPTGDTMVAPFDCAIPQ